MPTANPVNVSLNLNYQLNEYMFDGSGIAAKEVNLSRTVSKIRYVVRAYPVKNNKVQNSYVSECNYIKSLEEGYNNNFSLELAPGEYEIMVWSDIVENGHYFHNATDFAEITLQGVHEGNNVNREAFKGSLRVVVKDSDINCSVKMERPTARFKLVADDLVDFILNQSEDNPSVNLDDYSVVVSYVGYMPSAYSMITDKPVDSSVGVYFTSSCYQLNDNEAVLGYDYVFANENSTTVTVQVALYNRSGKCVSSSKSTKVELKRNHCTLLKGSFLSSEPSEGIKIETKYDGAYNIKI